MRLDKAIYSILLTLIGVLLGIRAVYHGIRLDWAEVALVGATVLITVGIGVMMESMRGGNDDEF